MLSQRWQARPGDPSASPPRPKGGVSLLPHPRRGRGGAWSAPEGGGYSTHLNVKYDQNRKNDQKLKNDKNKENAKNL